MPEENVCDWCGSEIMTVREVAQYLRLSTATVYKLAQAGAFPGKKIGRAWRFKRELLDEWIKQQSGSN